VGIMRSGAAYVPLDPKLPEQRLRYLAEVCDLSIAVSQRHFTDLIAALALKVVAAEQQICACFDIAESCVVSEPVIGFGPSSLAYVLFTSGSTGKPKGVMIEQRSLVIFAWSEVHSIPLKIGDKVLHACTIVFDPSVYLVYSPLFCGASIVIGRHDAYTNPDYLHSLFIDHEIAFTELVPSVVSTFLAAVPTNAFSHMFRRVYISGEAMSTELALYMLREYPWVDTWNTYGPTEVTITSHAYKPSLNGSSRPNFGSSVPIGPPLCNTTAYILDTNLRVVPLGVIGELYSGGSKVARGYIGRPDLTAAAFVHSPDLPFAGRLYKTGDRVRFLPDGSVEFLGRVDFQIKLNGQRIEAGEIEAVLRQVEGVRDAVVMVRLTPAGQARLVAYVVPSTIQHNMLLQTCEMQLPGYMVPAAVVALEV
jgi:amino acid adenylation domain-containing protein